MTAVKFHKHTAGTKVETGGLLVADLAKLAAAGLLNGAIFVVRQTYEVAKQQSHWLP